MKGFERGSEWRRWDLHIHTPETKKNDQFTGSTSNEKWELFYNTVSNYIGDAKDPETNIAVIGITDYLSVDNYQKVINDNRLPESVYLILPNVELRITPLARNTPINIHCIFAPEIVKELEDRFFQKLTFTYNNREYCASHSELKKLGRDFTGNNNLSDDDAYKCGINQFVVNWETLNNIFQKDLELRENTIVILSNSRNDGASGVTIHDGFSDTSGSQMDATRRSIYRMSDMIFSANENDRKYFLGKGSEPVCAIKKKYGSLKACVHGSDAHSLETLFNPNNRRYCWIKSDPTFNGLRQVLYEPEERVQISPVKPEEKHRYHVIDSIKFNSGDFGNITIPFNDKLNCIVGGKSTGKSLLLHNLARAIDEKQVDDKLLVVKSGNKNVDNVEVIWADGTVSKRSECDKIHKIVYIPQTYLNRLSDKNEEVTEIDNIIHDIIMINENAKKAYAAMCDSLTNHKIAIDKSIYDLLKNQAILNKYKEAIVEIGNKIGLEGELATLKEKLEILSKETALNDCEIAAFNSAESLINKNSIRLQLIEKEKMRLDNISSVIQEKSFGYLFSTELNNKINVAIKEVVKFADDKWAELKNVILSELIQDELKIKEENQKNQEIVDKFSDKILGNNLIVEVTEKIKNSEAKLDEFREKEKYISDIELKIKANIKTLSDAFLEFASIRRNYAVAINENKDLDSEELEFNVEVPFRTELFKEKIEKLFDKRILKTNKNIIDLENFSNEWLVEDNIKNFIRACLDGTFRFINNNNCEGVLREILNDYYNVVYRVKMDNDLIDEMSPGKKALVLLKMLINMADSKCPILIDQPEDDLDNRSIFNELIPFIRKKKVERQIIIVTHNANVVLGGDAEEIIVANQNGKNAPNKTYRFEYRAGAIEDDKPLDDSSRDILNRQGIQQHICDILEGGETAFDLRKSKYHI